MKELGTVLWSESLKVALAKMVGEGEGKWLRVPWAHVCFAWTVRM